jgi:integrase
MSRPRKDGADPQARNARKLTELYCRKPKVGNTWDEHQRGLCLKAQPSGHAAWYAVYRRHGRPRWYHIADAGAVGLADARRIAAKVMLQAAEGGDPAAERRAERGAGTFAELADHYLEHAKRRNRSWPQARKLVERFLLPRWGKLKPADVERRDVKNVVAGIAAPIVANQTLAAASAIFSWAIEEEIVKVNPCSKVERNPTQSRDRVLSEVELPLFWAEMSAPLKFLLLTGQRPGEVTAMRWEHVVDGWWQMPSASTKTQREHRIWIPEAALAIIAGGTFVPPATGNVFSGRLNLGAEMRAICAKLSLPRATPHDLRRSHGTTVTALGFGRDLMNRIQNHAEGGIATVYDRHGYGPEIKRCMEAVAAHIIGIAEGRPQAGNVVNLAR